jgi:CRISPR/Cas system CMR-associated protein Cmr5 small subunit
MELLAGALGLRGQNLEKALKNMLANTDVDEKILEAFKNNSLFKQLSYQFGKKHYAPSYLGSSSFQSILFDVILEGKELTLANIKEQIQSLPDEDLRNVLNQLLQESEGKIEQFKANVETWYNNIMDRASGWYKRYTQRILVLVGFLIAITFNADTIAIYGRLEKDPEALKQIVDMAYTFAGNNEQPAIIERDPDFELALKNVQELINQELASVKTPLGLGWTNVKLSEISPMDWLIKILGWTVTALSVSLGAPFWFDLLRSFVNLRSSGNKPK